MAGFIEAITATAALGWVWNPDQAGPLTVELRLGEQVVAEALADGLRDDLARSGIGEGRHAFSLPIGEELRSRITELRVCARLADGSVIPLGSPPAADGVAERLGQLQRGVDMLMGSQRLLHRNVQAVLLRAGPADTTSLADVAAAQTALQQGIETLELFVVRLEQALSTRNVPAPSDRPRLGLAAVGAVSLLALAASGWALARVMLS
ncbi:MAG: hypothetical protein NVSMB18_16820 [Acetobacteraceae bacterium]